jgi:hypothetical protein
MRREGTRREGGGQALQQSMGGPSTTAAAHPPTPGAVAAAATSQLLALTGMHCPHIRAALLPTSCDAAAAKAASLQPFAPASCCCARVELLLLLLLLGACWAPAVPCVHSHQLLCALHAGWLLALLPHAAATGLLLLLLQRHAAGAQRHRPAHCCRTRVVACSSC